MIKIIVTGHGMFADGMKSVMEMLSGIHEGISFVNFNETMSTDELETVMRKEICNRAVEDSTLVLCDLVGGTPFKTAAYLSRNIDRVEIIGGMNLAMLIEALFSRDTCTDASELTIRCINSLEQSIQHFTLDNPDDTINSDEL